MEKEGIDALLVCGNQYAGFEGAVLYMSGFPGDAMIRRGALHPEAAFLPKPFAPADLAEALRSVLERAAA